MSMIMDVIVQSTVERDFHGGRLAQRNAVDSVTAARGSASAAAAAGANKDLDGVNPSGEFESTSSSDVTSRTSSAKPLTPASTVYKTLGDIIAGHETSQSCSNRSAPPRHGDVVHFTSPQVATPAVTADSGLPNIHTFIENFCLSPPSSATGASIACNSASAVSSTFDSSAQTAAASSVGDWPPRLTPMLPAQTSLLSDGQLNRHHHMHHHHHHQHLQQQQPFFTSSIDDRLLHVGVHDDDVVDGEDFFSDVPNSHTIDPSVMDDGTDGVNGFLSTPDSLQDVWGFGLRLFEPKDGVYDDDMHPLSSINSTPEHEGVRKIQSVCTRLGIGSEPMKWSVVEMHKWLNWVLRKHCNHSSTMTMIRPDDWSFDGAQLCCLGVRELEARLGPDADFVLTELEQWKQLGQIAAGCDIGLLLSSTTNTSMSSSISRDQDMFYATLSAAAAQQQDHMMFAMNNNNNNNSSIINNNNNGCSSHSCSLSQISIHRRPPELHHLHHQLSSYHDSKLDSSVTVTGWDQTFADGHMQSQPYNVHHSARVVAPSAYIKKELSISHDDIRSTDDSLLGCASSTANHVMEDLDMQLSNYKPWSDSSGVVSGRQSRGNRGSAKRTICLWQFLRELLLTPQSYQSWIRWIDRNRGIFKIEDSVRVAKLWGERKNRPAMNYDKLSRSIRQYYKKGIIQKTSNSKRLVYQFCPEYMT